MEKNQKVVLAYSGGLDTSAVIPWLKDEYDAEVIAVCCNAGQNDDFDFIKDKAIKSGASKSLVLDIQEEFITDYIWPTVKAGAIYEDYLLGTSMARPLMAKKLVEVAQDEGAQVIVHGCTGKGNDQVRFESTINALDPSIETFAPWRQPNWKFKSREDLIEFSKAKNVPITQTVEKIYSRDENIWHISHEGGNLEDPWNEHLDDIHVLSVTPEQAPDKPEYVEITFEKGVPVAIDGQNLGPIELLKKLNEIGARNGVGTIDIIENRLVGMKSRGVYETPGGTIIYEAHKHLEKLILDRNTMHFKETVALRFAELCYDGLWFSPLMKALMAFVDSTQEEVSGTIRMKLYKGQAVCAGSKSENSLFSEEFATFGEDEVYNQADAQGFITLWSLPLKIRAMLKLKKEGDKNEAVERKVYKVSE